jgi:hypothetical protein
MNQEDQQQVGGDVPSGRQCAYGGIVIARTGAAATTPWCFINLSRLERAGLLDVSGNLWYERRLWAKRRWMGRCLTAGSSVTKKPVLML